MRSTFALASVAGSLCTVAAVQAQVVGPPNPPQPSDAQRQSGAKPVQIIPDDKTESPDLRVIAGRSGRVFDGVLVGKSTATPPGMRVLVTEYIFEVHEWFKDAQASRTVTVRETGGEEPNGDGVCTVNSHKLTVNGRYLVFLRPDAGQVLFPFDRVLQVMDTGAKVADESGRVVIGLSGAVPLLRATPEVPGTNYMGTPPPPSTLVEVGPPTASGQAARPPRRAEPQDRGPIPAEQLFRLLRAEGVRPPAGPGPAGLNSAALGGADWNWCGYINGAHNFATWLPNNNNYAWFNDAELYWDQEVNYSGAGGWIFGYASNAQHPLRATNPVANDGWDNGGVPSDGQMTAGGYGTWAANGSPNGICFNWYTGNGCYRIRESDVFINPSNGANELQYRKSVVHEMGHSFGLGHEDRYVADMVSGTWRVPPNYALPDYLRLDDRQGARSMLAWANANAGASWNQRAWRDIATYSQSHPNVGSSGDVGPNVVQLSTYNASTGDNITISHLHVENRGRLGYSGPIGFNIYLSADTNITSGDYNVWSNPSAWGSYPAEGASYNFSLGFPIPPTIPTGNYYVGWIVSSGEAQLDSQNDTAIMVRDNSGGYAARTIAITGVTPYNDPCANALYVGVGTVSGFTATATTDGSASCAPSGKDVWYAFTSPCTGTLTLDTCGSGFDTVLSIHSGCPGSGANALACNDDFCGALGLNSQTSLAVAAGATYYIRLAGYDYGAGDVRSGAYVLHVNFVAAVPPNDNCGSATVIGNGTFNGSTICANSDGSASCGASTGSPDVWYRYTAPTNGGLHVDTCGSPYDTVLSVHTAACPGTSGNQIGCNDDSCGLQSSLDVPVTSGQTYLIRVSGWNGSYGTFTLHAGFTPANNDCSNALPIFDGATPFSTIGATTDGPTEINCTFGFADPQINQDIWYSYTARCDATVTCSLCGSNYDSKIAIYDGGCPGFQSSTSITCDDDFCAFAGPSQVSWSALTGHLYTIRVGGYLTNTGSGTINLSTGPSVNDACAAAIAVSPGTYFGSNLCATTDGVNTCGFNNGPDVWYSFTAPSGGNLILDTCGSPFDTVLNVHTACPPTVANQVGCNDDSGPLGPCPFTLQSYLNVPVTAGNTYRIRVAGYFGATGNFTLNVGFVPVVCYPNCDNSTTPPCLNVQDFGCFLNAFAANNPYANCDNSTIVPVLNVQDFGCFLNAFAAGCSGC